MGPGSRVRWRLALARVANPNLKFPAQAVEVEWLGRLVLQLLQVNRRYSDCHMMTDSRPAPTDSPGLSRAGLRRRPEAGRGRGSLRNRTEFVGKARGDHINDSDNINDSEKAGGGRPAAASAFGPLQDRKKT
jgi:hypothetical protein